MIKNVEELRAEAQVQLFRERKLALKRKVRLRCPKTTQHIASEISLLTSGNGSEGSFIKDLSAGVLRSKKFERHSRNHVWTRG